MAVNDYESEAKVDLPTESAESPGSKALGEVGTHSMQGAWDTPVQTEVPAEAREGDVIGNPERDAQFWHEQQHGDTCAIVAQEGIIEKHTGVDPGEDALRDEALENGWYDGGTAPADVGNLLDAHGVPTTRWEQADMDTLQRELAQGHDVIAGVDAGHLWQDPGALGEGHAVWVTGLEKDGTGATTGVLMNDSGNSEIGPGGRVPAETFETAWASRNHMMVSTQDASPLVD